MSAIPDLTTADQLPIPEKTQTRNMFEAATKRFSDGPKLQARIPGLTDLFEMAKDIPGDLKRAKYSNVKHEYKNTEGFLEVYHENVPADTILIIELPINVITKTFMWIYLFQYILVQIFTMEISKKMFQLCFM